MRHHANQRPARPFAPMRAAPRRLGKKTAVLQIGLGPGVAPLKTMSAHEMLVKMLGREALEALAIKPLDLSRCLGDRAARAAVEEAIEEAIFAFPLVCYLHSLTFERCRQAVTRL